MAIMRNVAVCAMLLGMVVYNAHFVQLQRKQKLETDTIDY